MIFTDKIQSFADYGECLELGFINKSVFSLEAEMLKIIDGIFGVGDAQFADFEVLEGEHAGHILSMLSIEYECGAESIELYCSCDSMYRNGIIGCQFHNRAEDGDESLKDLIPIVRDSIDAVEEPEKMIFSSVGHIPFGIDY